MKLSKLTNLASALLLSSSFLAFPVGAEEAVLDQATVTEVNGEASTQPAEKKTKRLEPAKETLRKQLKEYVAELGLVPGQPDEKGRLAFVSVEPVALSPTQKDYGKAVQVAYARAYDSALQEFAKLLNTQAQAETLSSFGGEGGSDAADFDAEKGQGRSPVQSYIDKVSALAGAKLDEALAKMGIDPKEYDACPPDERKNLLAEKFLTTSGARASLELGGVTIVNNQLLENPNGNSAVGIIVMSSPKTKAIAESLRSGNRPAGNAVGPNWNELLPLRDDDKLADLWGTRLLIGPSGPAVVAFGTWSTSYRGGNEKIASMYENAAMHQAEGNARTAFLNFMGLTYTSEEEAKNGLESTVNAVKFGKTGMVNFEEAGNKIIDQVRGSAQQRAKGRFSGIRRLADFRTTDDNGNVYLGCVLVYDFGGIQAANNLKNAPEKAAPKADPKQPEGIKGSSRRGSVTSNLDVF